MPCRARGLRGSHRGGTCPKGRSLETFRIYEALESGSIPVIELNEYARSHLPTAYLKSPILFVNDWSDAPTAMEALAADPVAAAARQQAAMDWYHSYMKSVVGRLEGLLEARVQK